MTSAMSEEAGLRMYSANTFFSRLRGLLGRRKLEKNEALHIKPCSDVHTFGMKYDLDVVFLDHDGVVIRIDTLAPNRWSICRGAHSVLEFSAGCAQLNGYKQSVASADRHNQTKIINQPIGERA